MSLIHLIDTRINKEIEILAEQNLIEDFSKLNPSIKDGLAFMTFSLKNIFKDFSFEDIDQGIVDSSYRKTGDDYGIDAFYLTADGELISNPEELEEYNKHTKFVYHIFQFKKGTGIDKSSILKLKEGIENFFINKPTDESSNSYMYDLFLNHHEIRNQLYENFDSDQIQIKNYICFSGTKENVEQDTNMYNRLKDIKRVLTINSYKNVEVVLIGAQELIDYERSFTQIEDKITYKKTFKYITETDNDNKLNGHICIVPAIEIANLVKKWKGELFEKNIRAYFNNKGINSKILNTSADKEEAKYFWSFNNGITITANKVSELPNDKYKLKGIQIVNGCQTSNTLYEGLINLERYTALKEKTEHTEEEQKELQELEKVSLQPDTTVLVKIIETEDTELIYRITETTNSQTPIQVFSLVANNDIHKNIEHFLKDYKIYYERRVNFYKNQNKSPIIDIKKLSQLYYSMIVCKPSIARSNPKAMFINQHDKIFPSDNSIDFKLYLVPIRINLAVEKKIRSYQRNEKTSPYVKTMLSYGKLHLCCFILNSILKEHNKKYNQKDIIKSSDEIFKALNDEARFEDHFSKSLITFESTLKSFAGNKKEVISSSLRKSEFDQKMIRSFK